MNLEEYMRRIQLVNLVEIEKVKYLFFYYSQLEGLPEFGAIHIKEWFQDLNFGTPNTSRLIRRIQESKYFVKGKVSATYKLHAKVLNVLIDEFPEFKTISDEIISRGVILPISLYTHEKSRSYITKICDQINASYEHNLFDGCAVLMRRLIEILLIHAHEANGIEDEIKIGDTYKDLKLIIDNALNSKKLSMSRNAKTCLDSFRQLGNFAAHRIHYTTHRDDLKNIALDFRATVEELMYKGNLRV